MTLNIKITLKTVTKTSLDDVSFNKNHKSQRLMIIKSVTMTLKCFRVI